MNEKVNLLDILLDKDNHGLIAMENEEGVQYVFEQVANVALDVGGEEKFFVVLKPVTEIEGIADDEAIVFRVEMTEEGGSLHIEKDEDIAIAVFQEYNRMLDEARGYPGGED